MAIQERTIEKSIKFFYENPNDPDQNYWVVYQNTENGPSIALSQSDDDYLQYPVEMFVEIVDFLVKEGLIRGIPASSITNNRNAGQINIPTKKIGGTTIAKKNSIPTNAVPQQVIYETETPANASNPIETFDENAVVDNTEIQQTQSAEKTDAIISRPVRKSGDPLPAAGGSSIKRKPQ